MLMKVSTLQGIGNVASLQRGLVDTSRRGLGRFSRFGFGDAATDYRAYEDALAQAYAGGGNVSQQVAQLQSLPGAPGQTVASLPTGWVKPNLPNYENCFVPGTASGAPGYNDSSCVARNNALELAWAAAGGGSSVPPAGTSQPVFSPPVQSPAAQVNPGRVTVANLTSGKQGFVVGDSYSVTISGASPNQPVTASATQNGTSMGTSPFGSTDSAGRFSTSGVMGVGQIGNWIETWYVGGVQSGTASFSVSQGPGPSSSQSTTPPVPNAGAPTIVQTPPVQPATGVVPVVPVSSPFDFLTSSVSIFSMSIPIWALAGAGVAVAMYAGSSHR